MFSLTRVTFLSSGFVVLGLFDLFLRLFWLERGVTTCNPGVFWGLALPGWFILFATSLTLGVLLVFLGRERSPLVRGALIALIVGGTVNLVDRLVSGCVLDYFSWPLGLSAIFPNFNVGDMLVLLGLVGLGGAFLKRR